MVNKSTGFSKLSKTLFIPRISWNMQQNSLIRHLYQTRAVYSCQHGKDNNWNQRVKILSCGETFVFLTTISVDLPKLFLGCVRPNSYINKIVKLATFNYSRSHFTLTNLYDWVVWVEHLTHFSLPLTFKLQKEAQPSSTQYIA